MNDIDKVINLIKYYLGIFPDWKDCTKASCWQGLNAERRHMNGLSPAIPFSEFKSRVKWAEQRGCNCLHLFLVNKGDGEGCGYSVMDSSTAKEADRRIRWAAKRGMGIVLWCMADDSNDWAKALDFDALMTVCKHRGWLDIASTIVVGLECDEYWNANEVAKRIATVRQYYHGKVGVHETSGHYDYAYLADILFYQVNPGKTEPVIRAEAEKVKAIIGRPLNFFELSRHDDRDLCEAAFAGGAYGVGNW